MMQRPDPVQVAYDDWVQLLKHTKNENMLQDPYNVWLEAFHVGGVFQQHHILRTLQAEISHLGYEELDEKATLTVAEVKQLQLSLYKRVLSLIGGER